MSHYGLPRRNVEGPSFMLHVQLAANHDGIFLKLRRLPGLLPSCGAAHVRDAEALGLRIYAAKKLVNDLGHIARCLNARRLINVGRQKMISCYWLHWSEAEIFQTDPLLSYQFS